MNGEDLWFQLRRMIAEYERSRDPDSTDIGRQFAQLQRTMMENKDIYPSNEGARPINRLKNRYKDVLPYDKYRVELKSSDKSDYINASYVEDFKGESRYIAAQGPIDESIEDFFRMIWEFQITSIVCAANDTEAGRFKFRRYWPDGEPYIEVNSYRVSLNKTDDRAYQCEYYAVRPLIISQGNSHRHVLLYHLLQWFDHDVPSSEEPIYDLLIRLDKDRISQSNTPILVHCSAGCGRTGSIIAIDLARLFLQDEQARPKGDYQPYPVYAIATHIRQYRIALIQTIKQYLFVHKMFVYMLEVAGHVTVTPTNYPIEENASSPPPPPPPLSSLYSSSPNKCTRRSSGPFLDLRNPPIRRRSSKNATSKTSPAVLQSSDSVPISTKNENPTVSIQSSPPPIPPRGLINSSSVAPPTEPTQIKRRILPSRSRPVHRRLHVLEADLHSDHVKSNRSDSADALSSPTSSFASKFDEQGVNRRAGVIFDHGANSD